LWSYGSWETANGVVYSIQHYVMKFISDLRQVDGFIWVQRFKTDRHDITEKLLKVALSTITIVVILFLHCISVWVNKELELVIKREALNYIKSHFNSEPQLSTRNTLNNRYIVRKYVIYLDEI
jgi:hypothetical protein